MVADSFFSLLLSGERDGLVVEHWTLNQEVPV